MVNWQILLNLFSEEVPIVAILDEYIYIYIRSMIYMNINVHYKETYWYFGLVNFVKLIVIVNKRLAEFGIDFGKDIIASTNDCVTV